MAEIDELYRLIFVARDAARAGPKQGAAANLLVTQALDEIDPELLRKNGMRIRHPLLHEVAQQFSQFWEGYREAFSTYWCHPKLKPHWDDPDYRDEYGNTALQRLAACIHRVVDDEETLRWIGETFGVRPCREPRYQDWRYNPHVRPPEQRPFNFSEDFLSLSRAYLGQEASPPVLPPPVAAEVPAAAPPSPEEDDLCKICFDAQIDAVLVSCGHMVACKACASPLALCPMCRAPIEKVVQFYRS